MLCGRPGGALSASQAEPLLRTLIFLSLPILAENLLHMLVGFTDTWLAGHLREGSKAERRRWAAWPTSFGW